MGYRGSQRIHVKFSATSRNRRLLRSVAAAGQEEHRLSQPRDRPMQWCVQRSSGRAQRFMGTDYLAPSSATDEQSAVVPQ